MLDNFDLDELRAGVEMVGDRAIVEASGGITLDTIADVAATGVDVISVGALTHSVRALDLALDVRSPTEPMIYLDEAATTPLKRDVLAAMGPVPRAGVRQPVQPPRGRRGRASCARPGSRRRRVDAGRPAG